MYYSLKSGAFTYVIAIGKVTGPIVRREQSWPIVSVLEDREVPVVGEGETDAGGGGDQEKGAGLAGRGLGEYGDYEGGVEGGVGVVLSIGGYDTRQSLLPTIPVRRATTSRTSSTRTSHHHRARRGRRAYPQGHRDRRAHARHPHVDLGGRVQHRRRAHHRRARAADDPLLDDRSGRGLHARGVGHWRARRAGALLLRTRTISSDAIPAAPRAGDPVHPAAQRPRRRAHQPPHGVRRLGLPLPGEVLGQRCGLLQAHLRLRMPDLRSSSSCARPASTSRSAGATPNT